MGDPTKAQLQQTLRQQRERIQQIERERDEALDEAERLKRRNGDLTDRVYQAESSGMSESKPPRLRILELPSEWDESEPPVIFTPFVFVLDRVGDWSHVEIDLYRRALQDAAGSRATLFFRFEIQLGEDWEQGGDDIGPHPLDFSPQTWGFYSDDEAERSRQAYESFPEDEGDQAGPFNADTRHAMGVARRLREGREGTKSSSRMPPHAEDEDEGDHE